MPLSSIRPPSLLPNHTNFVLQPSNAYPEKRSKGLEPKKNDSLPDNHEMLSANMPPNYCLETDSWICGPLASPTAREKVQKRKLEPLTSLEEGIPNVPSKNEVTEAFSMGLLLLDLDPGLGGIRKERFLGSFVRALEDYTKGESAPCPADGLSSDLPGTVEVSNQSLGGSRSEKIDGFPDQFSNAMVSIKRGRQHCDSEDKRTPKRSRLLVSDSETSSRINTCPPETSSQKTVELLRTYAKDISAAKRYLYLASHAPRLVPDSQWERILRGQVLDLNHFLWAQCHISSDIDEPPQTTVQTPLEWVLAWRNASKAVSFAFPHRAEELKEYGVWIEDLFFSREPSDIPRIIRYDIAVRNKVAGGQRLSLLDLHRFSNLYESITIRGGREYNIPRGFRSSNMRRHKICYKFNSMHGCSYSDAVCRYRHVCMRCRMDGHIELTCPC